MKKILALIAIAITIVSCGNKKQDTKETIKFYTEDIVNVIKDYSIEQFNISKNNNEVDAFALSKSLACLPIIDLLYKQDIVIEDWQILYAVSLGARKLDEWGYSISQQEMFIDEIYYKLNKYIKDFLVVDYE